MSFRGLLGGPFPGGSKNMLVNAATALFPTDGAGGTAASVDPAYPATGSYLIEGLSVVAAAAGTLTIMQGDGTTTLCTISIPAALATATYIPIGGPKGAESAGQGLSAKLSAGSVTLWFQRVD